MGIQYFVSLSEEKVEDHFIATDGYTNIRTLTLQGCKEQPFQDFLLLGNRVLCPYQNGFNDYLRFSKFSINAARGSGGGRGA